MTKESKTTEELAQKLYWAEIGYDPKGAMFRPLEVPPSLDNIWPCDREKYIRMAEAANEE